MCTFARLIEEPELGSDMERWLYVITNIGTGKLQECPFDDPIFQDFFEQGQTEKLTPMEKENDQKSIFDHQDVQATIKYERELAMDEGMAKEKLAMAKSMLQNSTTLDTIISSPACRRRKSAGNTLYYFVSQTK